MKLTSLFLALLVSTLPTKAASVDVQADYSINGNTAIDNGGLPGHVGAVVEPGWDGEGNFLNLTDPFLAIPAPSNPIGQAQAYGDAAGNIAVQAGFLAPGGGPVDSLHAKTVWSSTVTNLSGGSQAYTFNFQIAPGGILAGADAAGTWNGGGMQASYNIKIMLGDTEIWSSGAALRVGKDEGTWHDDLTLSGFQLGRTFSTDITYGNCPGYGNCAGYTFGSYSDQLNLGTFANNASFTVSYLMEVNVAGPIVETGAYAVFGDPLNLNGEGGSMFGQVTAVPEPETWAMLLAGLGLVGWMARQRG